MKADFLRRMNWLGEGRSAAYLRILAIVNMAMLAGLVLTSRDGIDRNGFLLGSDFVSFWATGRMLNADADPYDTAAHIAGQRSFHASQTGYTAFFYPPSFLPFCLPLGLLGYFPALGAWLVVTGGAYCAAVRAWAGEHLPGVPFWLSIAAFPAVPIVITHGQTAFMVAALLGFGGLLVPSRPVLAGVLMGLATIKPQFGLLVPLALMVTREWKVIAGALVSAAALAGLATVAFGAERWGAWVDASSSVEHVLAAGIVGYAKMMSTFAALKLLGVSTWAAYIAQAAVASIVAGLLVRAGWRRRWSNGLAALMLAGAPLVTPFVLDYDMVLLAFPLLWLLGEGLRTGFRDWEKLALLCAFIAPAFARPLAMNLGVPVMPLALAGLFMAIWRRATHAA